MKCPKCGYVGFEHVDRCRNCGYEFLLASPGPAPELPIRGDREDAAPLEDLALTDGSVPLQPSVRTPHRPSTPVPDLPLFGGDDLLPLITKPSAPRAPLAVRRATAEVPRVRREASPGAAVPSAPMLDLVEDSAGIAAESRPTTSAQPAALAARAAAAAIDLALLAAVDIAVVYFTIKICGLTLADLHILPAGPLVAFLIVQNGGYLVAFTAGGQTLGKMAAGIRVVSARADATLDVGRSALRTLVWAALVVPAGLGFLTTLFNTDRRGLHDRCAGTRVVRASA